MTDLIKVIIDNRIRRAPHSAFVILLSVIALTSVFVIVQPVDAADTSEMTQNNSSPKDKIDEPLPAVGRVISLYDGTLESGPPDTQKLSYITLPFTDARATQTFTQSMTILDTTFNRMENAGYFAAGTVKLDREKGFTLRFGIQVLSEFHNSRHRAGFSVIALSDDLQGIELGFWKDEIWAQEGGGQATLFQHAEWSFLDTTLDLILYELTIHKNLYSLSAYSPFFGSIQLLKGPLRDYTAFEGVPDVYEVPNLIFLGDNSGSSQAKIRLSEVSVITTTPPEERAVKAGQEVLLDNIGLVDRLPDTVAHPNDVALALYVDDGSLTVATSRFGITKDDVLGNGLDTVIITGTVNEINRALNSPSGLVYQSRRDFGGTDRLTLILTQSRTGAEPIEYQQTVDIIVQNKFKRRVSHLPILSQ